MSISLDACTYRIRKLPYFLKNSKIWGDHFLRGRSLRKQNLFDPHIVIYREGYAENIIGEPRRHLGTSEIELGDRFPHDAVFETPIVMKLMTQIAI